MVKHMRNLNLAPWKRAFHLKLAGIMECHRLRVKRAHKAQRPSAVAVAHNKRVARGEQAPWICGNCVRAGWNAPFTVVDHFASPHGIHCANARGVEARS